MAKTRPMRVPEEFEGFINNLSTDFSQQTGLPHNNSATMRRMATKLDGKLIVRGVDFDFALLGRKRKR